MPTPNLSLCKVPVQNGADLLKEGRVEIGETIEEIGVGDALVFSVLSYQSCSCIHQKGKVRSQRIPWMKSRRSMGMTSNRYRNADRR